MTVTSLTPSTLVKGMEVSSLVGFSVQFSSVAQLCLTLRPHEPQHARPPCPSRTPGVYSNSCPLSRGMPSNHLILCRPLLLLPSIFPSIRVFSNESALCMRWPKYWSFMLNMSPSNEHPELIFRMDWWISLQSKGLSRIFSNTTVQKHHFFGTQPSSQSNSHIHTWPRGKTIALTRRTLVGKVMSLLLNILSRLVITFLPGSKHLLISWLQTPSAVILEPPENRVWHCFHSFPIYFPWSDRTGCHDFRFLNVEL